MIDNFLKHSVEATVYTQTDVAADWVGTHLVTFSIGRLTEWHINLLWIPLPEGENLVIILHLLSNNSGFSAKVMIKRYSHLTNMFGHSLVVLS